MHVMIRVVTLLALLLTLLGAADPATAPVAAYQEPHGSGWSNLLSGSDLKAAGWFAEADYWTLKDGVLVGDNHGKSSKLHHHALLKKHKYLNYEVHCDIKSIGWNASVLLQEQKLDSNSETGLHVKARDTGWGSVWPITAKKDKGVYEHLANKGDWNHFYIKVHQGQVTVALNGVQVAHFQSKRAQREGYLGVGLHHRKATRVSVKNFVVRPITENGPKGD